MLDGRPRQALMLGYLCHLGADVVAHNHMVPTMIIKHFRARRVGHLYWEARADERLLGANRDLSDQWRRLSQRKFPDHDRFLTKHLVPTILSNRLSAGIYKQSLRLQRRGPWRMAMELVDGRSALEFDQEDLLRWRKLAVRCGALAMENPMGRRLNALDPVGASALKSATTSRKNLRRYLQKRGDGEALDALLARALRRARTVDINVFLFQD
jgi:hypothetical protein